MGLDAGVPWLFGIFATCSEAVVHVLGIDYSIWSLALFVLLLIGSLVVLVQRGPALNTMSKRLENL